jgi:hypothetical protein
MKVRSLTRTLGLVTAAMGLGCVVGLSPVAFADDDPPLPPACGAEPGSDPTCGAQLSCTSENHCDGPKGSKFAYCCKEANNICTQFTGRWECCGTTWQKQCTSSATSNPNCDTVDGQCFG